MNDSKRFCVFNTMMQGIVDDTFRSWLVDNGFFTAPASQTLHGNYEGGLFDHSMTVTEELVRMTDALNLNWQRQQSPWIVGMFHDLCKIDAYKKVVDKEGKVMFGSDEVVGEEAHYIRNHNPLLVGHGEKSVMLLSQFMTLTLEEIACIRYHMGAFEAEGAQNYSNAVKKFPTILFTHTADMIASQVKNI